MANTAAAHDEDLAWLTHSYDQVQRMRTQTGQRITDAARRSGSASQHVLQQIQRYRSDGPAPALGRLYQRLYEQERQLLADVVSCMEGHPAWSWLKEIKGLGPLMAARLLNLLDVHEAESPSAFWERCGLATVPAIEYLCEACGLSTTLPKDRYFSGKHSRPDDQTACEGRLEPVQRGSAGARVAQPRMAPGREAGYDPEAKRLCYVIGMSFLRAGGAYAEYYQRELAKLARERPAWIAARRELTAMRKMEKLFLSHLWAVWREAEGLRVPEPRQSSQEAAAFANPWQATGVARSAR